jgi:PAS domain S-box-containing protein
MRQNKKSKKPEDKNKTRFRMVEHEMGLKRQQMFLESFSQAAVSIQKALSPDDIYKKVGHEISSLGFESMIFELKEGGDSLVIKHMTFRNDVLKTAEKLAGTSAIGFAFPLKKDGYYTKIFEKKQAMFFPKAHEPLAEALPTAARPMAKKIAAVLRLEQAIFVPMFQDEKAFGLFGVTGRNLKASDMPFFNALALHTAVGLKNTDLYQRIKRSERKYRALFESANDAIFLLDLEGNHFDVNKRAADLLGYTIPELLQKSMNEIVAPEELGKAQSRLKDLLNGKTLVPYKRHFVAKDGTRIPVEINVTLIYNSCHNPIFIQSIAHDARNR